MKKMSIQSPLFIAVSCAVFASAQVMALEPAAIDVGGFKFVPTIELSETYDDNFRGSNNAESSWIMGVKPTFTLSAEERNNLYELQYSFNTQRYHSSSRDNHTDHHVTARTNLEFDVRNRLNLNAGWHKTEDVFGSNAGPGALNDRFTDTNFGAAYVYGAPSAQGNIEVGYNHLRKRSDNSINLGNERNTNQVYGVFYYGLTPKLRGLAEVRRTYQDYRLSSSDLDSTTMAYLAGLSWDATAKTTGTAKLGYEKRKFDASNREDASGSMWEVGVQWQPLTYSTFALNMRRGLDEGDDGANAIESTNTSVNWNHRWSSFISSDVNYAHLNEDYADQNRTDKTQTFGVGLTYELRRWMDIGVGYTYSDKSSDLAAENFDRNLYMLKLNVSL